MVRKLDAWIEAGMIASAHGIRGEVIVVAMGDLAECFNEGTEIRLTDSAGSERSLKIEQARPHKDRLIVKFVGIRDRSAAERLRSLTAWLSRDQIGPLDEGRWFVQDVLGIDVYTEDGEHIGKLTDVMHMPANDVYVVTGDAGEVLLPVIADVVKDVDVENGRMLIHLMEGLRREAK